MRIFVDMNHSPVNARHSRPAPIPQAIPQAAPATIAECHELRTLLESNLLALHAILEDHQRTLDFSLRAVDGMRAELRAEMRALSDARAPWVKAVSDTRALLYVALRELIVGAEDAGRTVELRRFDLSDVPSDGVPEAEPEDHRTR